MKKIKLGNIGKVCMCKRILKHQTSPHGEIPFYKISTFGGIPDCFISRETFEKYKEKFSYPKKGDILISAAGTLGKVIHYDGEEAFFQDSNIVWIDNDESQVINDYLYYFFLLKPWKKTTGSIIARLYNDDIRNIEIGVPSLETQKKITAVLSALDNKIVLNKKINATLEAMAKTLYDYWFVQFDFPDDNSKPYKTSGGEMIYSSELWRDIPAGWEVDTLEKFGRLKNGINYDKNTIGDCRVKIVNVKDISNSSFSIATESLDDINLPEEQIRKYLTTSKDILIARSGIPGAVRTLADENFSSIYCGFIICFQPHDERWKNFLMFTLQKHYEIISTQSAGTIMQNITQDTLKNFRLIVPPLSVLENFNRAIELMISEMNTNILESRRLAELRDWMLPMLMNGQIKFKET